MSYGWEEVLERAQLTSGRLVSAEASAGGGQAWIEVAEIADPIQLDLQEGLLLGQARSSPWGPGYHQRAVELIDELGIVHGGWQTVVDTTDYFETRDRHDLERCFLREAYSLWEPDLWSAPLGLLVGLDPAQAPARVPQGMVATPTGFRDAAWVYGLRAELRRAILAPPGTPPSRAAREAFLWWCREPDAFDWVQFGRVLCTCEVIWRPLSGEAGDSPGQVEVRQRAFRAFETALALDASVPVPRAEFKRLATLLGTSLPKTAADPPLATTPFQGGYREGYIRRRVGAAWKVQLPGWLRVGYDAGDGHDVFWDEGFTVHLTVRRRAGTFRREGEIARHLACLPKPARAESRVIPIDQGRIQGYAIVLQGLGSAEILVCGQVACGDERISFTAAARSPESSELALRLPQDFSVAPA
ncbi:MAG: hypothetical protein JKY65_20645 [Planctomycetes bacterium]|nr:hypothetical protein [Planctomycetota bacterium]